jgi:hypothetical protein
MSKLQDAIKAGDVTEALRLAQAAEWALEELIGEKDADDDATFGCLVPDTGGMVLARQAMDLINPKTGGRWSRV